MNSQPASKLFDESIVFANVLCSVALATKLFALARHAIGSAGSKNADRWVDRLGGERKHPAIRGKWEPGRNPEAEAVRAAETLGRVPPR